MRKLIAALAVVGLFSGVGALQFGNVSIARAAESQAAPTGSISGKVVDSNGNPVSGAMVRIMRIPNGGRPMRGRWQKPQPGKTNWHKMVFGITATADDGTFTANNAPVGRYRIMVMERGVGFGHTGKPLTVSAGANADAGTITLHQRRPGRHHPGGRHR